MVHFNDKSIFFIGDSITTEGGFLRYLRAYFTAKSKRVYLHNKGVPGNRMDMVTSLLDEELSCGKPDFAVVSFGVNDLGIWLYDANQPTTDRVLADRKYLINHYAESCAQVVSALKAQGIVPVLCSPFCANENVVDENEYTMLFGDKKERRLMDEPFYTKATFKNINAGLKDLRDIAQSIATRLHVLFWDMYAETLARTDRDCFMEDGVHYTDKGYKLIAEILLEKMYGEKLTEYPVTEQIKEIALSEHDERAYYFVKYNIMAAMQDTYSDEELLTATKNWLQKNGYAEGLTKQRAEGFFRFAPMHSENQANLMHKIRNS